MIYEVCDELIATLASIASQYQQLLEGPATEKALCNLEETLEVVLPSDYRDFLKMHNGCRDSKLLIAFSLFSADGLIAIAVRTIAAMIQNKTRTIVACCAGMSRAPTIAAASVALMTGRDPDECLLDIVSGAPNDVSPILWAQIKPVYNTG